jgi:hypothetical protein
MLLSVAGEFNLLVTYLSWIRVEILVHQNSLKIAS